VTGITELTGMEGDVITTQDIFLFERTGIGEDGRVKGLFRATGIRPSARTVFWRRQGAAAGDLRTRQDGCVSQRHA
jgi:hypothetical protein